jgi:hypothetical protein
MPSSPLAHQTEAVGLPLFRQKAENHSPAILGTWVIAILEACVCNLANLPIESRGGARDHKGHGFLVPFFEPDVLADKIIDFASEHSALPRSRSGP